MTTETTAGDRGREADALLPLHPRDYLILFALADGRLHGYGILKVIEDQAGGVLFDPANLYRSLRKLERDGQVREIEPPDDEDDRRSRYYRLTPLGREVLEAEARRLARLTDAARARDLVPGAEEL